MTPASQRDGYSDIKNSTTRSSYDRLKVTYAIVAGYNSDGFPGNYSGILVINRMMTNDDRYTFQEFHPFGRREVFKRTGTSGGWTDWTEITGRIERLDQNS